MIGPNAHAINYFEPDTIPRKMVRGTIFSTKKEGATKAPRCLPLLTVPRDKRETIVQTIRPAAKFRARGS